MSRLVADSLELQDASAGYYFEIRQGGLDGHPEVRGSDVTIPGKPGQTWMPKVAHARPVTLHGIVMGQSSMGTTTAESFRTRMDALRGVFDPAAEPFPLTIHDPLHGVSGTATINVVFLRFVNHAWSEHFTVMDIECVCIDDPPEWVIGS
jgi:hypothetical protein